MDKPIHWIGTAQDDLRAFPSEARKASGYELRLVQRGFMPTDWKPFSPVGAGTYEIRVSCDDGAYRIMYVAKFEEAVYVLHCFEKRSRKTTQTDIDIAKTRYRDMIRSRKPTHEEKD